MAMRRYGRLPVLFWSQVSTSGKGELVTPTKVSIQVLALGFLIGNTFSPNLATFAGEYPSQIESQCT